MKRLFLFLVVVAMLSTTLFAENLIEKPLSNMNESSNKMLTTNSREGISYEFFTDPISLTDNFYDYFPGGYSSSPMRRVDASATGGINGNWIVYHTKATSSSNRRVYKAFVGADGSLVTNTAFNTNDIGEGYPTVAVTEGGRPIFAFHANNDTDAKLESVLGYDAVISGTVLDMNSSVLTGIDNPTSFEVDGTTYEDNEFIWPTLKVGPSPVAGSQRVYVLGKNAKQNGGGVSENVFIMFKDFTEADIENQIFDNTGWETTTIPTLNEWNVSNGEFRRPYFTFLVHEDAIYYVGYHIAAEGVETDDDSINEANVDIFKCDNYGEGTWERTAVYAGFESYNPNYINPTGDHTGTELTKEYFDQTEDQADEDFYIGIGQSGHSNVVVDNLGRIHIPTFYTLKTFAGSYYPGLHTVKDIVYNTATGHIDVSEVYPQSETQTFDITGNTAAISSATPWLWWDTDSDGITDEILDDGTYDGEDDGITSADTDYWGQPVLTTIWPYMYWDETVDDNKMMFGLHMARITEANDQGMMAMVWSDSQKARNYNKSPDNYPELTDFAQQPETYITFSVDNGTSWLEPIVLSSVDVPEFAGQRMVFVEPGNKLDYIGVDANGHPTVRLYLFYMDDSTFGSTLQEVGQATAGSMKYAAIDVKLGPATPNADNNIEVVTSMLNQNYPNPFNPETTISYNVAKAGNVSLTVYNSRGQLVKTLVNDNNQAGTHNVVWNGTDKSGNKVSSGLYFYRIKNAGRSDVKKMVLMK